MMRNSLVLLFLTVQCLLQCVLAAPQNTTSTAVAVPPKPTGVYPLPIPCTGPAAASPPGTINYQDFSVIRRASDNQWFRFSKNNHTGLGLDVATSTNFSGPWYYSYAALSGSLSDPDAQNRSATELWAPEVHHWNGTYYLYYSVFTPNATTGPGTGFDIAVATSPNMTEGSWTDHGSVNIPAAPVLNVGPKSRAVPTYLRIGQNVLRNASHPNSVDREYKFMSFGDSRTGIFGIDLADDLLSIKPGAEPQELIADQHLEDPSTQNSFQGGNKTGASFALKHDAYIYLFYSIGACCARPDLPWNDAYHIEVCRTNYTSGPSGPYVDKDGNSCLNGSEAVNRTGTVIQWSHGPQVYVPGSVGVTRDEKDRLIMYYQYRNLTANATEGLRMGYNFLEFDTDAWPYLSS